MSSEVSLSFGANGILRKRNTAFARLSKIQTKGLMMVPKMATEMPAVMIVRMLAPSQTMSSGARADLGRLLSTTR